MAESRLEQLVARKQELKNKRDKLSRINSVLLAIGIVAIIAVPVFVLTAKFNVVYMPILIMYGLLPLALYSINLGSIRQLDNDLNEIELDIDIETFDIDKEVSYAEKTLRLHNSQLK